jgi:hypothetical protein
MGRRRFFEGLLGCTENHSVPEILASIESDPERAKRINDLTDSERPYKFREFLESMADVKDDAEFINVNSELDWTAKEIQRFIQYWRKVNPDWPKKSAREDIENSKSK